MQKAIKIIFAAAIFAASAQALKVDIELGNRATKADKVFKAPPEPADKSGPSGKAEKVGNGAAKGMKASATKQGLSKPVG